MGPSSSRKFRINSKHKKTKSGSPSGAEIIWGMHPVLEALKTCPHAIREITVDSSKSSRRLDEIVALAREKGISVNTVSALTGTVLKKSGDAFEHESSHGVSASVVIPILSIEDLMKKLQYAAGPPLLLALDSIQDPHNLGAIIRSAAAAGAHGIILPKDRSASVSGTVIKISAGAAFHLDICRVTNLVNSFNILRKNGIWIFGAAKEASQSVFDTDLTVPACLVIGSEGKGLRPLVADQCDVSISIPMQGSLDSLNASVAAGIILFEAVRQRRARYS